MNKVQHLAIFCVNFHSYSYLYRFLDSVEVSAKNVAEIMDITVFVADNTEQDAETICHDQYDYLEVCVFAFNKNLGYFGAVQKMMDAVSAVSYDYTIICNVDLILAQDAFRCICKLPSNSDVGWYANSIMSKVEKRDRNPSVLHRYSLRHLKLLRFMFNHPRIHWLYNHSLYQRKKMKKQLQIPKDIYAGHGSFILLTNSFFQKCELHYSEFLYCEELYVAELCRINHLRVCYEPSIIVYDDEHVSTSKLKRSFFYQCHVNALSFIINTFYH